MGQVLNAPHRGPRPLASTPAGAPAPEVRARRIPSHEENAAHHRGLWQGALAGAVVTLLVAAAAALFAQQLQERALVTSFQAATEANTAGVAVGVLSQRSGVEPPPSHEERR